MAAKDYVFVTGMVTPYLAKKTKGQVMSQDRRPIEDNEIIGLFEQHSAYAAASVCSVSNER